MERYRKDKVSDIPPPRLEELHGSLAGEWRRPGGGALLLFVAAVVFVSYCIASGSGDAGASGAVRNGKTGGAERVTIDDPTGRSIRELSALEQALKQEQEQTSPTPAPVTLPPPEAGYVRLAAAQMYSAFGDVKNNRKRMQAFVERAAELHVSVLAFPEAAVTGYCDMSNDRYWYRRRPDEEAYKIETRRGQLGGREVEYLAVENRDDEDNCFELYDAALAAETAGGESVVFFAGLAKKYGMYLSVPFVEKDGDKYYSAAVLVGPDGKSLLHYRKRQLWSTADGYFATAGDSDPVVAETPAGRICLTLSYDLTPAALKSVKENRAGIVLQSCALYGRDFETTFRSPRFLGALTAAGASFVISNWTYEYTPEWSGYGMSRIVPAGGGNAKRVRDDDKEGMVVADVPLPGTAVEGSGGTGGGR